MKKKAWLKYFFIITLILLIVYWGDNILDNVKGITNKKLFINPYILYILYITFYIIIGLLLGLEHLLQEFNKRGKWRINIAKLVIFGLPSLYYSCGIFIYCGMGRFLPKILTYPIVILINNSTNFLPVFQLILGYSIITSLYKKCDDYNIELHGGIL